MDEAISFLITASQHLNTSPHIWEGHPDGELDSLGRRPRPILQEEGQNLPIYRFISKFLTVKSFYGGLLSSTVINRAASFDCSKY